MLLPKELKKWNKIEQKNHVAANLCPDVSYNDTKYPSLPINLCQVHR